MRFGSLFSGVEAASLAWEPLGWTPAFFAEVDPFCCELLRQRWPSVPNLGDVTADDFADRARALGQIDVLIGGSPCQSYSTAGKRLGSSDPRGQLTYRYVEIAAALKPQWVVWENVPGVLSSAGGKDLDAFVCDLEDAGYLIELDALDAQFFGVPQRRRRVFAVCREAETTLRSRTPTSESIILQRLVEMLRRILAAHSPVSKSGRAKSAYKSDDLSDGLRRKTRFFEERGNAHSPTWVANWGDTFLRSASGIASWASAVGESIRGSAHAGIASSGQSRTREAKACVSFSSIASSWSDDLAVVLNRAKSSTTSTGTSSTTDQEISCCARMLLNIAAYTLLSSHYSPYSCGMVSSLLTAGKEFTKYAGRASKSVGGDREWFRNQWPAVGQALRDFLAVAGAGAGDPAEVLAVAEGEGRHPAAGGEAGAVAAGVAEAGAGAVKPPGIGISDDGTSYMLNASQPHAVCVTGDHTHALTAEGHDASEDGTGRGQPIVAFTTKDDGRDAGDKSPTLRSMNYDQSHINGGGQVGVAMAIQERGRDGGRSLESQTELAYALTSPDGGGRGQERNVMTPQLIVRRITPTECERLQGMPDGHTMVLYKGKPASDSVRYKAIGNSMAVPVIREIGRRLQVVAAKATMATTAAASVDGG